MSHEERQGEILPLDASLGHEPSEVGIRGIFIFGAGLVAMIIVAMVLLVAVMKGFSAAEKADSTTTADLVKEQTGDFPAPRLQRNTTFDMEKFRDEEKAALANSGWDDPKAGIAQIPIARAIDLIARERRLPRPKSETKQNIPDKPATEPSTKK